MFDTGEGRQEAFSYAWAISGSPTAVLGTISCSGEGHLSLWGENTKTICLWCSLSQGPGALLQRPGISGLSYRRKEASVGPEGFWGFDVVSGFVLCPPPRAPTFPE